MPKKKSELKRAAGKLISAVQKEWGNEAGESNAGFSEDAMHTAHQLLLAADEPGEVRNILGALTVTQFLGEVWVRRHPSVKEAVSKFEEALQASESKS